MKRYFLPLILATLCSFPVSAQDIILLNQDGEKVGVAKDIDEKKIVEEAAQPKPENGSASIENGVVTVVGPDGEVQSFKMSDARSVTVTRSSKTVVGDDGQPKMETRGKAILIGPDGVRREIDLGPGGFAGSASAAKRPKSWMIGISVQPVSPVLRAQLQLEEDMGLVVTRVLGGGAAEKAGIEANDILIYGDQKAVGSRQKLSEIVDQAGADGTDVVFNVLRGGEEISISVTPAEREGINPMVGGIPGFDLGGDFNFGPDLDFEFRQFGPGLIFGEGDLPDGIPNARELHQKMMGDLEEQMQRMRNDMKKMKQRMGEFR